MPGITDFSGRVAVVTGGGSGIGLGIANALHEVGAKVVIADIEEAPALAAAEQLGGLGVVTDVARQDSVQALADAVMTRFGRIDVLCNNAGIGSLAPVSALTVDDWRWMLGVNLWGVIHGIDAFLPHLKANPAGAHIVNTSSIGGLTTMPHFASYSASKYAVVAISEALSQELAAESSNVGISVLLPGPVKTNLGKSRRNRPVELDQGGLADVDLQHAAKDDFAARWLDPAEVGRIALEAITENRLYAPTHPEMFPAIAARFEAISAAFAEQV